MKLFVTCLKSLALVADCTSGAAGRYPVTDETGLVVGKGDLAADRVVLSFGDRVQETDGRFYIKCASVGSADNTGVSSTESTSTGNIGKGKRVAVWFPKNVDPGNIIEVFFQDMKGVHKAKFSFPNPPKLSSDASVVQREVKVGSVEDISDSSAGDPTSRSAGHRSSLNPFTLVFALLSFRFMRMP